MTDRQYTGSDFLQLLSNKRWDVFITSVIKKVREDRKLESTPASNKLLRDLINIIELQKKACKSQYKPGLFNKVNLEEEIFSRISETKELEVWYKNFLKNRRTFIKRIENLWSKGESKYPLAELDDDILDELYMLLEQIKQKI